MAPDRVPHSARSGVPDRAAAIRLQGVVKRFGAVAAVDGLDLEVPAGCCFGLLGPNGAGKSTTLRMLTGQAEADTGLVEVLGHQLPAASRRSRARCGVVPQVDNLDDELTVAENLSVFARLQGLIPTERAGAVARGLARARLTDRADTIVEELSGGMRRRLLLARGLLADPELVLLDEPTVGLDPQVRQDLWGQIEAMTHMVGEAVTVVLSTHYIEEAERLCDEVAIMHAGRVVAQGRPQDLITTHIGREVLELGVADIAPGELDGVRTRQVGTKVAVFGAERLTLRGGHRRAAVLEDVFVALTGEELT